MKYYTRLNVILLNCMTKTPNTTSFQVYKWNQFVQWKIPLKWQLWELRLQHTIIYNIVTAAKIIYGAEEFFLYIFIEILLQCSVEVSDFESKCVFQIVPYDSIRTLTRKPTEGQARARFNFQAQTSMEMSLSKGLYPCSI